MRSSRRAYSMAWRRNSTSWLTTSSLHDAAVSGCDETIDLRVRAEMVEAGVTSAGSLRRIGVDALEILDDRFHRGMQAVKIEPVKAGLSSALGKGIVVRSQLLDKLHDIGVAPHPSRKAPEVAERLLGMDSGTGTGTANIAGYRVGIRPIRLDRDGREVLLLDEPFRDLRAFAIEFVRPVGGLAEQHKARVAD